MQTPSFEPDLDWKTSTPNSKDFLLEASKTSEVTTNSKESANSPFAMVRVSERAPEPTFGPRSE